MINPEEVRALFAEGLSAKQAAERLRCSDQTIYNLCRRENIELPSHRRAPICPGFNPDQAKKLYKNGYSDVRIAKELGVPLYAVSKWRKQEALSSNHSVHLSERKLIELHALGYSDSQIAAKLGCSSQTVLRRRRKYGLPANSSHQNSRNTIRHSAQPKSGRKQKINSDQAHSLYNEGLSDTKMALALGVSTGTVRNWRYRENLVSNANRYRQLESQRKTLEDETNVGWDQEQALELWLDGLNDYEIAEKLDIEPSVAEAWRIDLGLPPVPANESK